MEIKKSRATIKRAPRTRSQAVLGDVLSPRLRPFKINARWRQQYRHLQELHDFFVRQKETLAHDANEELPTYSTHMADAGTDSYDRDFVLGMLSTDQNALYEIDAALRRIETGAYGLCELTGKPIPLKRLAAVPWARFTLEAEKQLEQQGSANRAHLGHLGSLAEGKSSDEETGERDAGEASS